MEAFAQVEGASRLLWAAHAGVRSCRAPRVVCALDAVRGEVVQYVIAQVAHTLAELHERDAPT